MPLNANSCSYGDALFRLFGLGDDGNPFAGLWQTALLEMAVLAAAALVVLYLAGGNRRVRARAIGFGYLVVSTWSGLLALLTIVASLTAHLGCQGVPGSPPLSSSEHQANSIYFTLLAVGQLTLYLTVLLLVVLVGVVGGLLLARWRGRAHQVSIN